MLDRCVRCSQFTIVCSYCGVGLSAHADIHRLARRCRLDLRRHLRQQTSRIGRGFLGEVLTTSLGWKLIALGNGIGFLFALLVLTISAVSFRLCSIAMLERRSHFGQTGIRESGQGHRRGVTPFGALAPATSCRVQRNGPRSSVPKAWLARAGHHAA